MIFANVRNNKIIDFNCQYLNEDITRVETTKEMQLAYEEDTSKVIYQDGEIILNPNYKQEQEQKEKDRVNRLTMTPLDLIKAVKTLGISDEQVEAFLNNNLAIKHELQFCQNVYCGIVKQFLPVEISEGVMLTEELVEHLFKVKNGEES